jgi:serine/threonine-protein kinase RsbW
MQTTVQIRSGPLVGAVLSRVVGMLAARAQCPIDRLDDALLVTDAVAAHAPARSRDGHVQVAVDTRETGLELRVMRLQPDGARAMMHDADLPGVGNIFEQIADDVYTETDDDDGEQLVVRIGFAA